MEESLATKSKKEPLTSHILIDVDNGEVYYLSSFTEVKGLIDGNPTNYDGWKLYEVASSQTIRAAVDWRLE